MSFFHRCALGFFAPDSLVVGRALVVVRPLERRQVEALARAHGVPTDETGPRAALRWQSEGYAVVEHIALQPVAERVALVRAIQQSTGCDVVALDGSCKYAGVASLGLGDGGDRGAHSDD